MKLITANKLNRFWKNGIIPALAKKFDNVKILTTTEQVIANTSDENVVSAPVFKSLINDLNALNDSGAIKGLDAREDGVYITYVPSAGADPVLKKLGSGDYALTISSSVRIQNGENLHAYAIITVKITIRDGIVMDTQIIQNVPASFNSTWRAIPEYIRVTNVDKI